MDVKWHMKRRMWSPGKSRKFPSIHHSLIFLSAPRGEIRHEICLAPPSDQPWARICDLGSFLYTVKLLIDDVPEKTKKSWEILSFWHFLLGAGKCWCSPWETKSKDTMRQVDCIRALHQRAVEWYGHFNFWKKFHIFSSFHFLSPCNVLTLISCSHCPSETGTWGCWKMTCRKDSLHFNSSPTMSSSYIRLIALNLFILKLKILQRLNVQKEEDSQSLSQLAFWSVALNWNTLSVKQPRLS